jgi:hypothetical protein
MGEDNANRVAPGTAHRSGEPQYDWAHHLELPRKRGYSVS